MNFVNLSPMAVLGGVAALAAILYAAQRLRIRFQEQEVATLLFWKEALNEAPVRTFKHKFRHFWAYLFLLSICTLLWLAFAKPTIEASSEADEYVLLLDGSALMTREGRFQQALAALEADLAELPEERRRVIWCGSRFMTLLKSGEHSLLLAERVKDLQPEAVPSSLALQLSQLNSGAAHTHVRIYGDSPVSSADLERLPETVEVSLGFGAMPENFTNSGITSIGATAAASGEWGLVDLLVQVEGDLPLKASELQLTKDGQSIPAEFVVTDSGYQWWAFNVPADGSSISAQLDTTDDLLCDNRADITLPIFEKIRVQLSRAVPESLAMAIAADVAVELVTEQPDVVVRLHNEALGGNVPAMELAPAELQSAAFVVSYPSGRDGDAIFAQAMSEIGLGNIDAVGLAEQTQKTIEVTAEAGEGWSFSVWQELMQPSYNFIQSRAFPLFVAHSIRWLAGAQQWYPYAAVGRPLPAAQPAIEPGFINDSGQSATVEGERFFPVRPSVLSRANSHEPLAVTFLDRDTTLLTTESALLEGSLPAFTPAVGVNLWWWLVLLALVLLTVEWWSYNKGRMP
ncbi:hypothetical protein QP938_02065 [Porticoccaceae bacterium LTM1]|nr:hypothetical protein QP938_02065 [Porticoccaceae bacterium LTM1]